MLDQATICAIATSPGMGAIATIRLSGEKAIDIAEAVFQSTNRSKKLANQKANTLHYGTISEGAEIIDEVVMSLFRAPHSFTGEDIIEIGCHGSVYIQQRLLQVLIKHGARMARPGEFTQRAFLNGKMDLSQAEAVADLIFSSNASNHKMALKQMRGGFSKEISKLRGQLLHFIAMVELELDFSEEDVEFADRKELVRLTTEIEELLAKLANSFKLGNVLKNGVPVAIVGETNVGKSTLLNALLKEEKAIVSDIHGTTRDVIEDVINIDGTAFRFFDTAGIRETTDQIENLGIERSYSKLEQAEIVLLVTDLTNPMDLIQQRIEKIRERVNDQELIIVGNKADLAGRDKIGEMLSEIDLADNENVVFISAKQQQNLDSLIDLLKESANLQQAEGADVIVSNIRHFEALTNAHEAVVRVIDGLNNGISGDFLAQDIRECLHYLGEITGEISNDEVLGHIFKNFCIGK
ncbi:tRNA uridine-5-carboxymethylaminomethyl(34) synthesis GTPase MnmE [Mangrovibacterium diazotrophicum]|uniref:tRNA modification GTPase MnmE n=1 Tax=Mangrovibacterium diazotrophicum TaxID=1261403 RepID=A0A419W3N9_9BACT|nr:tRNA uridine-5-carboxymethylaminomethyl(34) synthesis GTPase MnmE [Mangrovibacterium diazotrophicum]RKD90059.1 tRNA modification GTPase trmE [Mangrovibacterium diazotrophicum]